MVEHGPGHWLIGHVSDGQKRVKPLTNVPRWVYSSETTPVVAQYHTLFMINESSTAVKVNNGSWLISYG